MKHRMNFGWVGSHHISTCECGGCLAKVVVPPPKVQKLGPADTNVAPKSCASADQFCLDSNFVTETDFVTENI